jgi:hypothetical protein
MIIWVEVTRLLNREGNICFCLSFVCFREDVLPRLFWLNQIN